MWTLEDLNSRFPDITITKERWYAIGGVLGAAILVKVCIKFSSARHFVKRPLVGKVVLITGGTAGKRFFLPFFLRFTLIDSFRNRKRNR